MPDTIIATGEAFTKTFGLVAIFGGIGLVVNAIIAYIAIQVRGEHEQNKRDWHSDE